MSDLDRWTYEEPNEPGDVEFFVVQKPPRKLKGVWRDKKMRADRSPAYLTDHRNEKHVWLRPVTMKHLKKIGLREIK